MNTVLDSYFTYKLGIKDNSKSFNLYKMRKTHSHTLEGYIHVKKKEKKESNKSQSRT